MLVFVYKHTTRYILEVFSSLQLAQQYADKNGDKEKEWKVVGEEYTRGDEYIYVRAIQNDMPNATKKTNKKKVKKEK